MGKDAYQEERLWYQSKRKKSLASQLILTSMPSSQIFLSKESNLTKSTNNYHKMMNILMRVLMMSSNLSKQLSISKLNLKHQLSRLSQFKHNQRLTTQRKPLNLSKRL